MIFVAELYTVAFFFAGILKMVKVFKQIEILKKSEKLFIVSFGFFILYIVYGFVDFIVVIVYFD